MRSARSSGVDAMAAMKAAGTMLDGGNRSSPRSISDEAQCACASDGDRRRRGLCRRDELKGTPEPRESACRQASEHVTACDRQPLRGHPQMQQREA